MQRQRSNHNFKDADKLIVPYTNHVLYIALGMIIISSLGAFVCLLYKVRACSHVSRASASTPITNSNQEERPETLKDESSSGHYWIIESSDGGESTTFPEAHMMQSNMLTLNEGQTEVPKDNALQHSRSAIDLNSDIELEDYITPIHSGVVEHDGYIHPVHDDYIHPANTDVSSRDHTAEI
ncbi:hypothetical protein CHS0354_014888 [Potamilus streckersoni]|uniref:Uncharacterized protein n=1 Tax=Potamilus streckersoni TaxID=2493646 RepID=A0AAE0RUA0_9BIVA|nr:hypothetical protein CHS0354_014888 [Potamilus streckersoni]